ncbi:MAG TPA: hypothetical protein VNO21_07705 [Polyangiaceae bacterium]|nr:hypothetical protein [Polyangiaceae bacterium]
MTRRWIGVAILATGLLIVVAKVRLSSPSAQTPQVVRPRIVLVADLGEAEDEGGCGKIIRMVRATAGRGVPTIEIDPEKSPDDAKKYKALLIPTVIVTSEMGEESQRYQGESAETIRRLEEELDKLRGKT